MLCLCSAKCGPNINCQEGFEIRSLFQLRQYWIITPLDNIIWCSDTSATVIIYLLGEKVFVFLRFDMEGDNRRVATRHPGKVACTAIVRTAAGACSSVIFGQQQ